jgi:hypothetical protein
MPTDPTFEVVDRRKRGYFTVDNVLLDVYGAQLGPYGIAVYCCLARFANREQECWPSFETIAKRTGMSRRQVVREIALLEQLEIIAMTPRLDDRGRHRSNLYILLDIVGNGDTQSPRMVTHSHPSSDRQSPKQSLKNSDLGSQDRKKKYIPDEYADIIIG